MPGLIFFQNWFYVCVERVKMEKKLADKGEKHTKLGHFLSIQKFAQCEEQLNDATFFPF